MLLATISEAATLHSRKESYLFCEKQILFYGACCVRHPFIEKDIVKQSLYEAFNLVNKLLQLEKISTYMCRGCLLQNELQEKMS